MDQEKIMRLLKEAAQLNCTLQRRAQIQSSLEKAASMAPGRAAGVQVVLDMLYTTTVINRPDLLPTLFPAFAVMCGDRSTNTIVDSIVTDVDWSLMD